jgi:hypothetical protein
MFSWNRRLRSRFQPEVSSVVLILDEISTCAAWQQGSDILRNLRSLIQAMEGDSFIVADARPLYEISKDRFSAFFNVFTTIPLGALIAEETEQLIVEPGASVGIKFTAEAVAMIKQLTACKPYYIQVLCCSICEWLLKFRAKPVVNPTVVDVCTAAALRRLGEHFSALWGTLTAFQKSFTLDLLNSRPTSLAAIENFAEYERQHREIKLLRDRQLLSLDSYNRSTIEPLLGAWLRQFYAQSSIS